MFFPSEEVVNEEVANTVNSPQPEVYLPLNRVVGRMPLQCYSNNAPFCPGKFSGIEAKFD